jgi:outer membrane lipoprotein SlyB
MSPSRNYPLMMAAGISVIIFSLVGIAAFTGVLPSANSKQEDKAALATAPAAAQKAPAPVAQALAPVVQAPAGAAVQKSSCPTCGVIAAVRAVEVKADTSGVGAVAGGVAGAVVGNQFGHGDGRTVMTIAGAAGGAFAGNEIEKHVKKHKVYKVTVRMDDGRMVTVNKNAAPAFAVGERVRLNGNAIERG